MQDRAQTRADDVDDIDVGEGLVRNIYKREESRLIKNIKEDTHNASPAPFIGRGNRESRVNRIAISVRSTQRPRIRR